MKGTNDSNFLLTRTSFWTNEQVAGDFRRLCYVTVIKPDGMIWCTKSYMCIFVAVRIISLPIWSFGLTKEIRYVEIQSRLNVDFKYRDFIFANGYHLTSEIWTIQPSVPPTIIWSNCEKIGRFKLNIKHDFQLSWLNYWQFSPGWMDN